MIVDVKNEINILESELKESVNNTGRLVSIELNTQQRRY
jgi:hypothetical protein